MTVTPLTVLFIGDVRAGRFEDPQAEQPEHGRAWAASGDLGYVAVRKR